MQGKIIWTIAACVTVLALLASCGGGTTPTTTTTTPVTTTAAAPTTQVTTAPTTTAPAVTTTTPVATTAAAKEKPQYGGILSVPFWQGLASMDPADSPNYSGYFEWMIFETLTQYDFAKGQGGTKEFDYRLVTTGYLEAAQRGRTAESWEVVDDKTIVFTMRKGLNYALDQSNAASRLVNGRAVTAQDMEFAARRSTANLSMPLPGRDFIVSWTATDKSTLVLKLNAPLFSFWVDLVNRIAGPYPPEVVAKYGDLKDWRNWVGTGPFFMKDFVPDSSATFVKNPNYWGTDELNPENRLPYIDGLKFLWITDIAARTAAFRTRKIDMISQLPEDTILSIQRTNPDAIRIWKDVAGNGRMWFNTNEPPFDNVRVRQAMVMAIDFDTIVRDYYKGGGEPRGYPMDAGGDYYTPTDQLPTAFVDPVNGMVTNLQDLWTYKPDKAKALLAEAGYPNGFEFPMTVHASYVEQAMIFVNYWKAIGATAKVETKDARATAALRYQAGNKAAFKGVLFIQSGGSSDPSDMDQQAHTGSAWNSAGYSSAYFDETYNRLAGRLDLGPVHDEMVDLSLYIMTQIVRLDFPLRLQSGMIQSWIKQYYGTGGMTGPAPFGVNHAARLWIDESVKKSILGK